MQSQIWFQQTVLCQQQTVFKFWRWKTWDLCGKLSWNGEYSQFVKVTMYLWWTLSIVTVIAIVGAGLCGEKRDLSMCTTIKPLIFFCSNHGNHQNTDSFCLFLVKACHFAGTILQESKSTSLFVNTWTKINVFSLKGAIWPPFLVAQSVLDVWRHTLM